MKLHAIQRFTGALVGLCLFLSFAPQLQAQSDQCLPDCFNDSFTQAGFLPPLVVEVPGQPGCFLEIIYGYRNACGVWHDFFIYAVIPQGGGCDPAFISDPNALLQTATTLLLMSNPPVDLAGNTVGPTQPTTPGDTNCVVNWRVVKGSCWKDYNGYAAACSQTQCCLKPYEVCKDYCGNVTVNAFSSGGAGGDCVSGEAGCIQVCD